MLPQAVGGRAREAQVQPRFRHGQGVLPPDGPAADAALRHAQAFGQGQVLGDRGGPGPLGVAQHLRLLHGDQAQVDTVQGGIHQKTLPSIRDRRRWMAAATSGLFMV